ncbi:MAG: MBL fold metallo-hydrolase [Bacteroidales bacterium]|nr:MBL fold metallo-hydrolase [Bacteroidales bacterium]
MKHISVFFAAIAASVMTASCISVSTTEFHAIPDSKTPMTMTPALFTNVPEGLVEDLGVENGIPSSMCAFLVKKDGKNILFDSGNGGEEAQLIPTLKIIGLSPEDIDYVFLTHLHGDHIGGMVNDGKAVFTNAAVYLNKDEYDGWGDVDESDMGRAYGEKIVLFTEDDDLPCGIQAIKAYGHTPGHTMYRIGDTVLAGDIMHATALQIANPESCARFDMDQEKSAESRKSALELFRAEGLKVYGMHFPAPYYIQF